MRLSIAQFRNTARAALLVAAAALLSGCQTTGPGPSAAVAEAPPPEPPMTRARAASLCWMATEKGHASANIDKRADVVTKCIDDKLKAAPKS